MLTRVGFEVVSSGYWLSRKYLMHLSWIKLASNPCGLDSSTGRAADRYPEGASSNPAQVNFFQLTSALSDYHEKFLFIGYPEFLSFLPREYYVIVGLLQNAI